MTSHNTLQTTLEQSYATDYPVRIAHGSEEAASELQCVIGDSLLTEEGCLVVPLVRPGKLRAIQHQTSQAARIVDRLRNSPYGDPVDTTMEVPYFTYLNQPSDQGNIQVRVNIAAHRQPKLRNELTLVNRCLTRWHIVPVGLDQSILLNRTGIGVETARAAALIMERHIGQPIKLGEPIVGTLASL